jgi:hypothetical protein
MVPSDGDASGEATFNTTPIRRSSRVGVPDIDHPAAYRSAFMA